MYSELYFPFDKIIAYGSIEIKGEKPSYIQDILNSHLDRVVIRRGYGSFIVSLNRNISIKISNIVKSNVKNKRQRIYQTLDTREPDVVDRMLERLLKEDYNSVGISDRITDIWLELSKKGHYCESIENKNFALDMMIFEGLLTYDDYGYYSLSDKYIKKVHNDTEMSLSKIKTIGIQLNDLHDIINIMSELGYFFNGEKMNFVRNDSLEATKIELSSGFMIGVL